MSKRLVVALSGGIGGAKLVLGLSLVLPADEAGAHFTHVTVQHTVALRVSCRRPSASTDLAVTGRRSRLRGLHDLGP